MNLSTENIELAVKQADQFMNANGASNQQRLNYCKLLKAMLTDYQDQYGEDVNFRLVNKREARHVFLSVHVACKSSNPLPSHQDITKYLEGQRPLDLFWQYLPVRRENVIIYRYASHLMNFDSVRYVWRYMKDEKKTFLFAVLLRFVNMALAIIEPLLSAWIITAYSAADIQKIIILALLILGQGVLSSIINYAASWKLRTAYASMLKRMQTELAERILKIRTDRMDKTGSGVFSRRLLTDTTAVVDGIDQLLAAATEGFRLVGILAGFFWVSPPMFFFELVMFTAYMLLQRAQSKSLQENDRETSAAGERHSGFVTEMARANRDIKLLHCEGSFMDKFSESVRESVDLASKMRFKSMYFILMRTQFVSWTNFVYMVILAIMMSQFGLDPPTAMVLFNYNGKVYVCASSLSDLMSTAYSLGVAIERIYQLMNSPDYEYERFGTKHIDNVRGDMEMRDVYFSYRQEDGKENPVLNGINLKINAGQSVAFVGRSGCGKTTILSLFSRLYDADSGEVLIDGIPVETLDQDTIRGSITVVSQMPYLFNMSVRDNLATVKGDLTDEEMIEACQTACIHDDIMALPDGYDTVIGEGGVQMSGGQRQRLALARSLLRNSSIIMLDEATSALDNITQSKITQAIEHIRGRQTIIMIAHRLSTVINCERLFFLSEGKVVASGTHQELLENCEDYRMLYSEESDNQALPRPNAS